jgi:hypothetical protein
VGLKQMTGTGTNIILQVTMELLSVILTGKSAGTVRFCSRYHKIAHMQVSNAIC